MEVTYVSFKFELEPGMPCILVVDDNSEVREIVCEFLRDGGHRVLSAASAPEARPLLARETVDLLIVDCVLSGEQGDSLAAHASSLGVPAILTSGDLRYGEKIAPPTAFLSKPFRLSQLEELVARTARPAKHATGAGRVA
jgi:CheY-like chemotaxis protein